MKKNCFFICLSMLFLNGIINAAPPATTSKHIKIDQFGYLPLGKKVAVIVDPQTGYNGSESFSPGTGANQYQIRRWADNMVVFTGTLVAWNSGATHAQSGDKGWYFDFSSFTIPGSYYVFDLQNNAGSYRFEISSTAYSEVLKQAARTFYYQRINFVKQAPYTDVKWADGAAFGGANQDYAARSRYDKTNPATARDLHGGWMDAGDYNKYTTSTFGPLCNLLETYRMHPAYFTDDYNIPESGNGIADILDEVKWEIDWLTRMQDATGTNGLLLKVGADNFNAASPPSADNNPRFYVPECTSSTITGAAVFSLASIVYKSLSNTGMNTYGNALLARATNAWNRAKQTTSNFSIFQTSCDDLDIKAGDADLDVQGQQEMVLTAATYLYEATGNSEYKNCFDTLYLKARPMAFNWWGPYYGPVERALLRYTTFSGAAATVANNIKNTKAAQNGVMSINDYSNRTDLYSSFLPDDQFHWGSNEVKANAGLNNLDFVTYNINTAQQDLYKETSQAYLHWFHGVNPIGKVMLSNMYTYGGDSCINEFYHNWFSNGSIWDNVFTSANGPAPGYVIGGMNKNFTVPSISPPTGQPVQKSFKEWNTAWNGTFSENSWEITENGIYYQAAYISLLVRVMANSPSGVLPLHILSINGRKENGSMLINWDVALNQASKQFSVQRSVDGVNFTDAGTVIAVPNKEKYSYADSHPDINKPILYYRIKETNLSGRIYYSSTIQIKNSENNQWVLFPNPVTDHLTLNGHTSTGEKTTIYIYNAAGKLELTDNWFQPAGSFSISIPVGSLAKGTYLLQIATASGNEAIRFMKQ